MMDKTPCKVCGRIGFVRQTTVIQGASAHCELYCGLCNRTWTTHDRREAPRPMRKARTVVLNR